jgi:hypothetical protein
MRYARFISIVPPDLRPKVNARRPKADISSHACNGAVTTPADCPAWIAKPAPPELETRPLPSAASNPQLRKRRALLTIGIASSPRLWQPTAGLANEKPPRLLFVNLYEIANNPLKYIDYFSRQPGLCGAAPRF